MIFEYTILQNILPNFVKLKTLIFKDDYRYDFFAGELLNNLVYHDL
jgi:hypothetical protein